MNRTNGMTVAGVLLVPQSDTAAELEAWQDAITALDQGLADVMAARAAIDAETLALEQIEASTMLTIEGANAETRKAKLTLALANDPRYQARLGGLRAARERLGDADRRVAVAKERCRLLRASLALHDRVS
jgi:hypothetical protein